MTAALACIECGTPLRAPQRGPQPKFCGERCKKRAARARGPKLGTTPMPGTGNSGHAAVRPSYTVSEAMPVNRPPPPAIRPSLPGDGLSSRKTPDDPQRRHARAATEHWVVSFATTATGTPSQWEPSGSGSEMPDLPHFLRRHTRRIVTGGAEGPTRIPTPAIASLPPCGRVNRPGIRPVFEPPMREAA